MSSSSEQVSRLFSLVPWLQAHPGVAVVEAARTFGVTPAQLMKDLQVLWMCGLPGGLPDDLIEIDMDAAETEGTIHLANADYLSRPLRFTLDEVMSLVVALRSLAEIATGDTARHVASALAKLESLTGAAETSRVAITVASGSSEVRALILDAIAQGSRLQLVYDGLTRGVTTRPVVDAARIDLVDGVAYLQAFSIERQAWRTYRLDRIASARVLGEPARDHGEPPRREPGWFGDARASVRLELAPTARWITEYYPTTGPVEEVDGMTRATFPVSHPAWLSSLLLRLGNQVRVIDPVEAGQEAAAAARAALAVNEQLFGSPS